MLDATAFTDPLHLLPYLLLALFMVVLAMLYTRSFYGLTDLFRRLPIRPHFKPAIGAFLTAVVGLVLYFTLGTDARAGGAVVRLRHPARELDRDAGGRRAICRWPAVLLAVALGKIVTTGLTIGSGGSGGVFGPSMVIGGCGGGALGILLNHVFPPGYMPPPASFVIVGMAGFFAAAAKTPLSTLVMVSELTGNYNLLLPTLWVCTIAFLLSDEQSIYSSQVQSRSRSPAHQGAYVREVLAGLRVSSFITPLREVPFLHPGDRVAEVIERLNSSPFQAVPVIDAEGRLLGVVTVEEVLLASQSPHLRASARGGGPDAQVAAAVPRRSARPGDGAVRRERSAGPAGGRWSGQQARAGHRQARRPVRHLSAPAPGHATAHDACDDQTSR